MRKILFLGFVFIFSPMASANLYQILGVLSDSSLEQMTKNYLRIKERIQPNNNSNSQESRDRFEELEEAYAILSDSDRRTQYDQEFKKMQKQRNIIEESNFYKLFGVLFNSSPEQITRAYKEIRTQVHPDHNLNNKEESEERFKELQKAFKTLADTTKRFRHDALLWRTNVIPHFDAERERKKRDLKENPPDRQGRTETVQTGMGGLDARARFKSGAEQDSEEREVAAWSKQVFELAKELEKEGGSENIEEAISWHRMLAQENHLQAAWRLAPLLEDIDIKEALYRYEQVQIWDSDGELARSAVFRQAQIYHAGVYKEEKTIFPPDPEKAAELYEEAFRLGVSSREITSQYDKHRDYQKALEWQRREGNSSDKQQLTEDTKNAQKQNSQIMEHKLWFRGIKVSGTTDLHLAVMHRDGMGILRERQQSVVSMIRSVFNEKTDINAQDSRGNTPINSAVGRLYFQAVELLLEMGADVNVPNEDGNTALHRALISWSLNPQSIVGRNANAIDKETVRQVFSSLVKKTDLSIRNNDTALPVELAVRYNHPEVAAEIIERGGAESLTNEEYHQLVERAIYRGHSDAVRLLKQMPVPVKKESSQTSPGFVSQLVNFCKAALSPKPKPTTQEAGDP